MHAKCVKEALNRAVDPFVRRVFRGQIPSYDELARSAFRAIWETQIGGGVREAALPLRLGFLAFGIRPFGGPFSPKGAGA